MHEFHAVGGSRHVRCTTLHCTAPVECGTTAIVISLESQSGHVCPKTRPAAAKTRRGLCAVPAFDCELKLPVRRACSWWLLGAGCTFKELNVYAQFLPLCVLCCSPAGRHAPLVALCPVWPAPVRSSAVLRTEHLCFHAVPAWLLASRLSLVRLG